MTAKKLNPKLPNPRDVPWTPDQDAVVRQLWGDDSVTVAEIGRRIGRTGPAVSKRARDSLNLGAKAVDKAAVARRGRYSDEMDAKVKELRVNERLTARDIAARLGISHNTVGRMLRAQGIVGRISKPKPKAPPRVREPRASAPQKPLKPATLIKRRRAVAVVDVTGAKTLMNRGADECCFPIAGEGADTLFCCAAVEAEGKSYCAGHAARMYVQGDPIKSRPYQPRRAA
jgi:hypothetical protein